jgi:ubiquinone/menaquinone biosynthesis C-methylase UbiE
LVDPRAATGFASQADAYARGRPGYPEQAIERISSAFGLGEESTVLDLAAGTGQLSALFLGRVGRVIAVEPSRAMRARIAVDLPGVVVEDGTAESIPLGAASVDAVVVGEAFHWFQVDEAIAELARVLTPRGGVALLWNTATWSLESTPWLDDFRRLVAHHKRAAGNYPAGDGAWRQRLEQTGLFEQPEHVEVAHTQALDPEGFLAQVASWTWIANLGRAQRQAVLDEVAALVGRYDKITIPYRTDLYLVRLGRL